MSARAHCTHCDHTAVLSLEAVAAPDFDFWCPRCRNMLVIEEIEDERVEAPFQEPVVREPVVREPVVREPVVREPKPVTVEPVALQPKPVALEPVVLQPKPVALEPLVLPPLPVVSEPVLPDPKPAALEPAAIVHELTLPEPIPLVAREPETEPEPSEERWPFRTRWETAAPIEVDEGGADPFAVLAAEVQAAIFAESRDTPGAAPSDRDRRTERHAWPEDFPDASALDERAIDAGARTTPTERFPELSFVDSDERLMSDQAEREARAIEDDPIAAELVASLALDRGPLEGDSRSDDGPFESSPLETRPEPEEPEEPDAFDELDVIEVTGGTRGTGSRTYDAVGRTPPAPAPAPPRRSSSGATPRPASPEANHGNTGAFARPPELEANRGNTGAFARPPAPGSGQAKRSSTGALPRPPELPAPTTPPGDDLDWYALIDEALPETADEGPDLSRVVIHLPEALAPRSSSDADAETLRRIQETLEARGIAKTIDASEPQAPADEDDTRHERLGREAAAVSSDPAATASIQAKAKTTPSSGRIPAPGSGRVPPPGSGRVPPPPTPIEPRPSDRAPVIAQESPPPPEPAAPPATVVEQFNRDDLDPCLVCARDPSSPEADYIKQLYQTIFHPRPGPTGFAQPPRIVLVTSARRGEGKTTVAANLAIVAARLPGRGALLVGADPRGGDLLRVFGLGMKREGLLEALDSAVDPSRFVLRFKLGNLDVLPLGVPGSDAAELISSDRIGEVIHGLAARYPTAVVILDGSSVLHAPDPLVLARQVDGVVLVVRADATAREDVERARDLIGAERILGVVLNQVSRSAV